MGEAKNDAHLSRLARTRGAIVHIGLFIALPQTLVRAIALLTVIADILLSVFDRFI